MQHLPAPSDLFSIKVAHFYKEGDQRFKPIRIVMKRKDYATLQALINDLNRRMWLQGGIKGLFTLDGRRQVGDIEEIENEGHYVCSSSEVQGKPVDPNNMRIDNWNTNKPPVREIPGLKFPPRTFGDMVDDEIKEVERELYGPPKLLSPIRHKKRAKSLKRLFSAPKTTGNFFSLKLSDISMPNGRGLSLPSLTPDDVNINNHKPLAVNNSYAARNQENWPRKLPDLLKTTRSLDQPRFDERQPHAESYAAHHAGDPKRGPGYRHWTVRIATGDMPAGVSTSIVFMTIYGRSGHSQKLKLASEHGIIYSGAIDIFRLRTLNVGTLLKIRLESSNSGPHPDWFCESVILEDEYSLERFPFICKNWFSKLLGDRCTYRDIPAFGIENIYTFGPNHIFYEVTVQTGDIWNAGTNGKVSLTIFGERGSSNAYELNNPKNHEHEPFRKNQTDIFRLESSPLGEIRHIRVVHIHSPSTGIGTGWFLDSISIRENDLHTQFHFPAWRWLSQFIEDQKLAVELRAVDNYNYICLQDKIMWPSERWKFRHLGAELVFYSAVSKKSLRITPGGFVDARGESSDRLGVFQVYDVEENEAESIISLVTKNQAPSFLAFSDRKQIVSKTAFSKNCNLRIHTTSNRTVAFESYKAPKNFVSVASNGQLYTENQMKSQGHQNAGQQFYVYVKGCFRDNGIVMLCTSRLQALCVDRDPSSLTALGAKNRVAHFRVHKVQSKVRMFESIIFPGHFLQVRKKKCDCLGKGDRYSEFKLQRCREENFVVLESVTCRGLIGFGETGQVRFFETTRSGASQYLCRIYPEAIEFGQRKESVDLMETPLSYDNDLQMYDTPGLLVPPISIQPNSPSLTTDSTVYHEPGAMTVNMMPNLPIINAEHVSVDNSTASRGTKTVSYSDTYDEQSSTFPRRRVGGGYNQMSSSNNQLSTFPDSRDSDHRPRRANRRPGFVRQQIYSESDEDELYSVQQGGGNWQFITHNIATPSQQISENVTEQQSNQRLPSVSTTKQQSQETGELEIEDDDERFFQKRRQPPLKPPPSEMSVTSHISRTSPKQTSVPPANADNRLSEDTVRRQDAWEDINEDAASHVNKTPSVQPSEQSSKQSLQLPNSKTTTLSPQPSHEPSPVQTPAPTIQKPPSPPSSPEPKPLPPASPALAQPQPKFPPNEQKSPVPPRKAAPTPKPAKTNKPQEKPSPAKHTEPKVEPLPSPKPKHEETKPNKEKETKPAEHEKPAKVSHDTQTATKVKKDEPVKHPEKDHKEEKKHEPEHKKPEEKPHLKEEQKKDPPEDHKTQEKQQEPPTPRHEKDEKKDDQKPAEKPKEKEPPEPKQDDKKEEKKDEAKAKPVEKPKEKKEPEPPPPQEHQKKDEAKADQVPKDDHKKPAQEPAKDAQKEQPPAKKLEEPKPVEKPKEKEPETKPDEKPKEKEKPQEPPPPTQPSERKDEAKVKDDQKKPQEPVEKEQPPAKKPEEPPPKPETKPKAEEPPKQTTTDAKKEEPPKPDPAPPKKPEPEKKPPSYQGPAPTVKPAPNFNPKADSDALNKAMKGSGTDEEALVTVLTRRTYDQREEIAESYKKMFSKDLTADIQQETDGNFYQVLSSLMKSPNDLAVSNLNASVEANGGDEDGLAEVICTVNHSNLQEIRKKYQEVYKKPLEQDLSKGGNAVLRRLLTSMLSRPPAPEKADPATAKADAKKLDDEFKTKDGEKSIAAFSELLSSRSRTQLRAIFDAYEQDQGKKMEDALKAEYKGDSQKAFLAVVSAIRNQAVYFAQRLNAAMAGFGPKNAALIRIIVSRCENDLEMIKQEYEKLYKKPLGEDVSEETFGDFETALTSLIKGNSKS